MKRLIPFVVLTMLFFNTHAQTNGDDFKADVEYVKCDQVRAKFYIVSSNYNEIDSVHWFFGEGVKETRYAADRPTHTYNHPGKYAVMVYIWIGGNITAISKDDFIIVHNPPKPRFSIVAEDTSFMAPVTIHFLNQTIPGDCDSIWYEWGIGMNTISTEKDYEYTFNTRGYYSFNLMAADSFGCKEYFSNGFNVKDTAQRGEFSYITSPCKYGEIPVSDIKKNFLLVNDTLFSYGIVDINCCGDKTATYRIVNDTIYIRTWESGELCTCDCLFNFSIKIPGINSDSVYVVFDGNINLVKSSTQDAGIIGESRFKIYPNPAGDYFYIECPGAGAGKIYYEIFDAGGKVSQEGIARNGSPEKIDLKKVSSGLALVRVRYGGKSFQSKLMINK